MWRRNYFIFLVFLVPRLQTLVEGFPQVPPVQVGPVKVAPSQVAPVKVAPAKVAPVKVAPAKVAPAKVAPVKVAPAKVAPVKVTPVKVAPVKVNPVETAKLLAQIDDYFKKLACPEGLRLPSAKKGTKDQGSLNKDVDPETRNKAKNQLDLIDGILNNPNLAQKCPQLKDPATVKPKKG